MEPRHKRVEDAAAASGASERQIVNWRSRLALKTSYAPPIKGRGHKTMYSYDNILELAWLKAFSDAGCPPSTAVSVAHFLVEQAKMENLAYGSGLFDYWITGNNDWTKAKRYSHGADLASIIFEFGPDASISMVPVRNIKLRVDDYFAAHGVAEAA